MIQFDEHIFQMGWLNHQLDLNGPQKAPVGYLVFAAWQEFAPNFDGATEETWAPRRSW